MTLRLAWFATARGTSSRLLLETTQAAIARGELEAEIVVVFCNRERGQSENTDAFLAAVDAAELPLVMISSGAWRKRVGGARSDPGEALAPWRQDFDRAVRQAIEPFRPEAGLLAGYMLVTTAELCEHLPLLNLHPAQPDGPVGTWREVNSALIAMGAERSGLMLQRATVDLDRGPILTWCSYPIRGGGWSGPGGRAPIRPTRRRRCSRRSGRRGCGANRSSSWSRCGRWRGDAFPWPRRVRMARDWT